MQVRALEDLLRKLPMPDSPETSQSPRKPRELPRKTPKLSTEGREALIAVYRDGATIYELADRFDIDRKTASRILHRHHVPMRRQGLSRAQAAEASELRAAGWTLKRIGDYFGVSARTVSRRLKESAVTKRAYRRT
jgi:hypothetical protein